MCDIATILLLVLLYLIILLINIKFTKCYYLLTLKFAPDWLVTNRMLEKLDNFVFSSDAIIFNHVDYNIITFLSDNVDFNTIGLHNINFNNDNFDEEDLKLLSMLDLWISLIELNYARHVKKAKN